MNSALPHRHSPANPTLQLNRWSYGRKLCGPIVSRPYIGNVSEVGRREKAYGILMTGGVRQKREGDNPQDIGMHPGCRPLQDPYSSTATGRSAGRPSGKVNNATWAGIARYCHGLTERTSRP
jgi:hypothetical protein